MNQERHRIALVTVLAGLLSAAACASGQWFSTGPKPVALAGTWVDTSKVTATDTVAWVLRPDGWDGTLYVTVRVGRHGTPEVRERLQHYGYWYLSGDIADTASRQLCFKRRSRDGGTCVRFRVDTLTTDGISRRLLTVFGYAGRTHTRDRYLLERLPRK